MPAGISNLALASETTRNCCYEQNVGEEPAFTILQGKNGLEMTLPMIADANRTSEESALDVLVERASKSSGALRARKRMSRSNDHLILASLLCHRSNPLTLPKKQRSKSQDNLESNDESEATMAREEIIKKTGDNERQTPMTLSTENFNRVLNAKLRKIEERSEHEEGKKGGGACKKSLDYPARKPFITTVKTGEFLMPPPEVAALLGGAWIGDPPSDSLEGNDACLPRSRYRPLVSLANRRIRGRPEVRHSSHNARCQAALRATVDFSATDYAKTPRALPKKLEPIEGMMSMLLSTGDQQQQQPLPFGNIMFDRRVIRGSTFASAPMLVDGAEEESQAARQAEARRRQIARKRAQSQAARSLMMRIASPPPVPGRKHEPVQTELYLEELCGKPDESEVGTQTDYFLDRPATPVYCPGKVGQDAETQIGPGDLFDYDAEVQPILEVLVGKTIEQALIEVLEEEELAALREQQRRFLELRAAEKAEQLRLEEDERRLREEKSRRVKQHEEAIKAQQETEERVAAAVLLTGYIAELLPAVLEGLKLSGFLLDEIKADVEEEFVPWLMKEVKKEMGSMIESRELLMEIIREILENRARSYTRLGQDYDDARADLAKSEETNGSSAVPEADKGDEGDEGDEPSDVVDEESNDP